MKNYLEMFSQNIDVEEPGLDDDAYNDVLQYDQEETEELLLAQIRRTGLPLQIRVTRNDGNCWYDAVSDQVLDILLDSNNSISIYFGRWSSLVFLTSPGTMQ